MCGRFLLDADYEALIERYKIFEDVQEIYERKIEIFPSEKIWTLMLNKDRLTLKQGGWGLKIPIEDKMKTVINSRSETLGSKRLFKDMKPCLIPTTGYYEWHQKTKEKYKIHTGGHVFSYAGLYKQDTGEIVIVTKAANEHLAQIHTRMPVLLAFDEEEAWLEKKQIPRLSVLERQIEFENLEPFQQISFL